MMLVMAVCMTPSVTVTGSVIVIPMPVISKDRLTVVAVPVLHIPRPVNIMTHPGPGFIDHYLISPVQIIAAAPAR